MHPNGQIPAYEWDFGDVNPPVHAWAVWRLQQIRAPAGGATRIPRARLSQAADQLHLVGEPRYGTGNNIFEGGFLGLDNIWVFDRSAAAHRRALEQSDGTGWMGMYWLNLMRIALELASETRFTRIREQVLPAFHLCCRRDEHRAGARVPTLGRRRRLLLRRPAPADGHSSRFRSPFDGGPDSTLRRERLETLNRNMLPASREFRNADALIVATYTSSRRVTALE